MNMVSLFYIPYNAQIYVLGGVLSLAVLFCSRKNRQFTGSTNAQRKADEMLRSIEKSYLKENTPICFDSSITYAMAKYQDHKEPKSPLLISSSVLGVYPIYGSIHPTL